MVPNSVGNVPVLCTRYEVVRKRESEQSDKRHGKRKRKRKWACVKASNRFLAATHYQVPGSLHCCADWAGGERRLTKKIRYEEMRHRLTSSNTYTTDTATHWQIKTNHKLLAKGWCRSDPADCKQRVLFSSSAQQTLNANENYYSCGIYDVASTASIHSSQPDHQTHHTPTHTSYFLPESSSCISTSVLFCFL